LAVVEAVQGSKLRLRLGHDAKSVVLPQRQIHLLNPLPSGVDPPARLGVSPWQLTAERISAARPTRREWGAAWLLLLEAEEALSLEDFTDLVCGAGAPPQRAACWLELMGDQQLFRLRQGLIQARPLSDLRPLRRERRRRQLEQQLEQSWLGLLRARRPVDDAMLPVSHRQRLVQLQQLAAGAISADQLEPGLRQSLTALRIGAEGGELRHLLVDLGLWDQHRLISLEGTTWSSGFGAELQAEADRLLALVDQELPGDADRLDLCGQHCVTIDDDDTRDIDDGLALERRDDGSLRLWIHVADPGRLIEAGSPLDLEARRRGSSLYLAAGTLPMFPEALATGPFSLRQGVRSAAWSFWVDLEADGEIAAYGIVRSWVRPTYRLSYTDADDLIDLAPPEDPDLADMDRLLERRRRWRLAQGALQMDLPEGRIRNRDGEPVLEITEPGPSRQLVAEAMILAGALAARHGVENGLALPYRSQLPADLRGLMGSQPAPHFSLGLSAYAQATSPIRRYGDLIVQRQIGASLAGAGTLCEDDLQEQLEQVESAVRQGIGISREDQRHWQQVWFERHRSGQWRAQFLRWLRPQDRLGLVRIDDLAMDLAAECPAAAEPGLLLLLRVREVDSLRDQLRLVASAN